MPARDGMMPDENREYLTARVRELVLTTPHFCCHIPLAFRPPWWKRFPRVILTCKLLPCDALARRMRYAESSAFRRLLWRVRLGRLAWCAIGAACAVAPVVHAFAADGSPCVG